MEEKEIREILEIIEKSSKTFKRKKMIQELKDSKHVQDKAEEFAEYMYAIDKIYCEKDDLKKLAKSLEETTEECIKKYKENGDSKVKMLLDILQGELTLLTVLASTKKIENDFDGLRLIAKELRKLAEVTDYIVEKEEK